MTTSTLARHLRVGRGNAVTIEAIAEAAGVPRRDVERAVQEARLAGYPIISGDRGLWVASSLQELVDQRERLRARARNQLVTARGLDKAIQAWSRQATLGLVA